VGVCFWSKTIAPRKWTGASLRPSKYSANFREMSSQRGSHCCSLFQTYCRWNPPCQYDLRHPPLGN
jgi:hypothetical protein